MITVIVHLYKRSTDDTFIVFDEHGETSKILYGFKMSHQLVLFTRQSKMSAEFH